LTLGARIRPSAAILADDDGRRTHELVRGRVVARHRSSGPDRVAQEGAQPHASGFAGDVNARRRPLRFRRLQRVELAGRSVPVAATRVSRLLGLALLRAGRAGEGLLIPRCCSVHTFGMRFSLHLIFLDDQLAPISVRGSAPPNRVFRERRADSVLELPVRRPSGGLG
jgi:uncharacterized protein